MEILQATLGFVWTIIWGIIKGISKNPVVLLVFLPTIIVLLFRKMAKN